MKKVLVLAVMLLLVCSAMAMASTSKWVINIQAYAAGFASDKTNMVGVSGTDYTEAVDSTFAFSSKEFGQEGTAPPGTQSPVTCLRVNGSNHSPVAWGYSDIRTPLNPGTTVGASASKSWSFQIYATNSGSQTDPGAPYTVKIAGIGLNKGGTQIAGADMPYEIAGTGYKTEYTYVFAGGIQGLFDVNNQLAALRTFEVTGNTFTLTVTAINVADVPPVTPEPGSLLALGSGLVGLIGFGIRRRK